MQKRVSLKTLNTFGIDVSAAEFFVFHDPQELASVITKVNYAPWVLGGGSNILLVDDLQCSVLHNAIQGIEVMNDGKEEVLVHVGGGIVWHDFVTWAVQQKLGGVENLALIPGRVGAAPIQNIGAYGVELKDVFVSLEAVNLNNSDVDVFESAECSFGYRDSIFKHHLKGQYCITGITLRLSREDAHQLNIGYGAVQEVLENHGVSEPGIRDVYNAVIQIRSSKLPDPHTIGNAGSFFKNPLVDEVHYLSLKSNYPKMPAYLSDDGQYKIPAGWLIEQCGWKGKRIGNVGCYDKQALVIVNYGGASGREILDHAMRVQASVKDRFGIDLTPEVNVIGV